MGYASTGPYHLTACPHCEELICVREVTPAAGLRAVMSAFDAHLAASVTCKAAQDARPTLAESLVALGEALGPEGAEAMFPREDDVIETLPVNETITSSRGPHLRVLVDERIPGYRGRLLLHPTYSVENLAQAN